MSFNFEEFHTTVLLFLEEYDADMMAERRGEYHRWETHETGATELIERLKEVYEEEQEEQDFAIN